MDKAKILIIEDDAEISRLTAMYLEVEGFESKVIDDGAQAIEAIKSYQPELIILDLMLPGISGVEICKVARGFFSGPILELTACDDDVSEVSLLKLGADDFLVKPLKPHVLVARIEALLRRVNKPQVQMPRKGEEKHSKLVINESSQDVRFDGKLLTLTSAEYEMLLLLQQNIGKTVLR